jgi:hypothetical protein
MISRMSLLLSLLWRILMGGFFPCSISCLIAINEKVYEDKNFDWPCPVGSQYFYFTQSACSGPGWHLG